jgi:hypothetical protein
LVGRALVWEPTEPNIVPGTAIAIGRIDRVRRIASSEELCCQRLCLGGIKEGAEL